MGWVRKPPIVILDAPLVKQKRRKDEILGNYLAKHCMKIWMKIELRFCSNLDNGSRKYGETLVLGCLWKTLGSIDMLNFHWGQKTKGLYYVSLSVSEAGTKSKVSID